MGKKLTVTVRGAVEEEFEVDEDEFESTDALAEHAREVWFETARSLPRNQLSVTVEPSEWLSEGRFGTSPANETEDEMLARMQREAEEAAGLG